MSESLFQINTHPESGGITSVRLFGEELLDQSSPCAPELLVNGSPLALRPYPPVGAAAHDACQRFRGERFVDHFSGWSLVLGREMGSRDNTRYGCFSLSYLLRREVASQEKLPCPGPGGPVVEAPLYVDTFSVGCWNWRFWGDDTRMIFPSLHSNGPFDEWGHTGHEHGTPEECKRYLYNAWRRIYPGVMAVHGGLFYNARTQAWLAITCRRPQLGYILNIGAAGRGVGYDFTLHAPFQLGDRLRLPEIRFFYGQGEEERMRWLAEYIGFYYEEPPAWVFRTHFMDGIGWNGKPTWTEQAAKWEQQLNEKQGNGITYCLVTSRPVKSGTSPTGYEPDPLYGGKDEFRSMCRRISRRGVPMLIWMSHSGMVQGAPEIDDDWFIRGIDGRTCASWGNEDAGSSLVHINPGHPGYIEYTKKWIRFYIRECGCKGIFMDCLGWAFPPDFRPRAFMRYPGDTNRMAVRFIEEIYACIKECDPEAILLGEGATFEAPVNIVTIHANPVRGIDGMGPRDFLLSLNRYSSKRFTVHQGPSFFPGQGMCSADGTVEPELNVAMTELLGQYGGPRAFVSLPGDLSIHPEQKLLVVPKTSSPFPPFRLQPPWDKVVKLASTTSAGEFVRDKDGMFHNIQCGIYGMH